MVKLIEKENALKVLYYLMLVDGVTSFEEERFQEIGSEILGDQFAGNGENIIAECENIVNAVEVDDERYDIIQENIDQALSNTVVNVDEGVVSRFLIWNMLSLAHSDSDYSDVENRLISHVARVLQIDKSVLAEMKQLISVAYSVQDEKQMLENESRPYAEIRPLIDENEKRYQTIIAAAKALITDEILLNAQEPAEEEKKENTLFTAGKKIGDSVISGSKKVGDAVTPMAKELGSKAMTGAAGIKEGAGKLFSKMKDATKKEN